VNSSATALATVVSSAALNRFIHVHSHPIGKVIVPPLQGMCMSKSASGEATGSSTAADKEFSCPECGKGYTTSNGLQGDGCSGYECPTCGDDSFYLKSGMEQHHAVVHSESLNKVKTECGYCGVVLKRHPSHLEQGDNVFCSDDCENDYKSEHMSGENGPSWKGGKVTVSCVICGEEKKVHPWQKEQHDRSFCSPECRGEWMKEAYKGEKGPNWKGGWDYHYGHNWDEQREHLPVLRQR